MPKTLEERLDFDYVEVPMSADNGGLLEARAQITCLANMILFNREPSLHIAHSKNPVPGLACHLVLLVERDQRSR